MTYSIQGDAPYDLLNPMRTEPAILGRTEPRIWTPPLRELTPETSYGFEVCEFAKDIDRPLYEWQEWLAIHAGEELPDGRPRFRRVLVLVSRQNGKTEVLVVLTLYWLFYECRKLILGTSTNLAYAKESWEKAKDLAEETPELAARIPAKGGITLATGQQTLTTEDKCRYKIAASNRRGGRSLTVHRLVADELREQDTWDAYNAGYKAMQAVWNGQAFFISNQGDDRAVVLSALRKQAIKYIETGEGDPRLGIFEWSAPDGSEIDDIEALAQANPSLNRHGIDLNDLLAEARVIKAQGTPEEVAGFKTESMCMWVPTLDAAIDLDKWSDGGTDTPTPLVTWRDRVALCWDVSPDQQHAVVLGAALVDDVVHLETVAAWHGPGCTTELRQALPALTARVRPRVVGWLPSGPAASVAAALADPGKRRGAPGAWPPRGVRVQEIKSELPAVCMGFAELVNAEQVVHPNDELINQHVMRTEKLWRGKQWVFNNSNGEPINATYAAAGAAHLARTLPPPVGKPRIIVASEE
jgi:hypothetical protein